MTVLSILVFVFACLAIVILLATYMKSVDMKFIYMGVIFAYLSLCTQLWLSEDQLSLDQQPRDDKFIYNLMSSTAKIFVLGVHLITDFQTIRFEIIFSWICLMIPFIGLYMQL